MEYINIISGIYQNGKWHIPIWKVVYTKMESGIYQNGKWHIPIWKVAYTKMESGIYQNGKWPKFIGEIYLCFYVLYDQC